MLAWTQSPSSQTWIQRREGILRAPSTKMKLSENTLGIDWLRQFSAKDVHAARLLLDSLKLVSFGEYEAEISTSINRICAESTGKIAIYTVDKERINPSISAPGSEHRLLHLVRNLQRLNEGRILINPTIDDMRRAKVDHVVLVDDFICSGQRIEDFWDVLTSSPINDAASGGTIFAKKSRKRGSIRSWLSFGYCKLWVVAYAVHETGFERIQKAIPYLKQESIRLTLLLKKNAEYWPTPVSEFLERVEKANTSGRHRLGWGNLMIPLVFQYGCPDNCPELLWRKSQYLPLFPNRAIPTAFYPCFEERKDGGRGPSLLLKGGQSRLAIKLLEEMERGIRSSRYIDIVTLLGLSASGYAERTIPGIMLRGQAEIDELIATAKEMGMLGEDFALTPFGRDIVERSRQSHLTASSRDIGAASAAFYLPMQFKNKLCGVQRKH
jgi:hypothetical protein